MFPGGEFRQTALPESQLPTIEEQKKQLLNRMANAATEMEAMLEKYPNQIIGKTKMVDFPPEYLAALERLRSVKDDYLQLADKEGKRQEAETFLAQHLNDLMPQSRQLLKTNRLFWSDQAGKSDTNEPAMPVSSAVEVADSENKMDELVGQARLLLQGIARELKSRRSELEDQNYNLLPAGVLGQLVPIWLQLGRAETAQFPDGVKLGSPDANWTTTQLRQLLNEQGLDWLRLPGEEKTVVTEAEPAPLQVSPADEIVPAPVVAQSEELSAPVSPPVEAAANEVEPVAQPLTTEQLSTAKESEKPPAQFTVAEFFYNGYLGMTNRFSTISELAVGEQAHVTANDLVNTLRDVREDLIYNQSLIKSKFDQQTNSVTYYVALLTTTGDRNGIEQVAVRIRLGPRRQTAEEQQQYILETGSKVQQIVVDLLNRNSPIRKRMEENKINLNPDDITMAGRKKPENMAGIKAYRENPDGLVVQMWQRLNNLQDEVRQSEVNQPPETK